MKSELFEDGSYWYFDRAYNYFGLNEFATREEARKFVNGCIDLALQIHGGKEIPDLGDDEYYKNISEMKESMNKKLKERKGFSYPIILFSQNGKLLVKRYQDSTDCDYEDGESPFVYYSLDEDFVLEECGMDCDVFQAIQQKFGIVPLDIRYLGKRIGSDCLTYGAPYEDGDIPPWVGQDVILCLNWEGDLKNISLETDEKLAFVAVNEFSHREHKGVIDYDRKEMLSSIKGEIWGYDVWASLLYYLIGEEKMLID